MYVYPCSLSLLDDQAPQSVVGLGLGRLDVIFHHLGVFLGQHTVKTLLLVVGHIRGPVVWNELYCLVNGLCWHQKDHKFLHGSVGSGWGANSVVEEGIRCLSVVLFFLLACLLFILFSIDGIIDVSLDITYAHNTCNQEKGWSTSKLNKQIDYLSLRSGHSEDGFGEFTQMFVSHHSNIVLGKLEVSISNIKQDEYLQILSSSVFRLIYLYHILPIHNFII